MLAPGTLLGPYEVISPLGIGGMGEVYVAVDKRLDRRIAIKVLPAHLRDDPKALGRFEEEAKTVASISHPNILAIHDVGSHEGIHFAVMELLEGETLRRRIAEMPLPWKEAVEIAMKVADGLAATHARGVIHRDLKPENIFLTRDNLVKILDFGLAHRSEAPPSQTEETSPYIEPAPGSIQGTVGYMSPEQLRCEALDPRTDLFSLGCVFYEMIMGERPFARRSGIDTMAAILTNDPDNIEKLASLVPPDIVNIIVRCLDKDREARFSSARDLAALLKVYLSGSTGSGEAPTDISITPITLPTGTRKSIDSIAVLPFVNASRDPNADYLSDGITETIINSLSKLPRLRVMASATVFRYRGQNLDPLAIGRRLGVRSVLTGRLIEIGEKLVIRTELVDVNDGTHVWGEQYERSPSDILALQNEIASEISAKLRVKLSGEEKRRLERRPTESVDAYQLYLKGRYHWGKRTVDGFRRAIDLYEQAIAQDPQFALAWVGIADCYITLATNVPLSPREVMPKAERAATRALEIDDELAEAWASLASIRWWHDWNRTEAERSLEKAISLNANYAIAHDHLGLVFAEMREFDRATTELVLARELDPLSLIISTHVGLPLLFSGKVDAAIAQFQTTLELDPGFIPALGWLGIAWEQKGNFERAMSVYDRALAIDDISIIRASKGHALAAWGKRREAAQVLLDLQQHASERYVSPYDFAVVLAGLGQIDESFERLDEAVDDRSTWMVFLRVDHRLDPLRDDPRMTTLLERMNFSEPKGSP